MISEIVRHIPEQLANVSGKVFYSGRDAFQSTRPVYMMGYNPGGDPTTQAAETVRSHTEAVLTIFPSNWSAYRDESWLGLAPGTATMQPVILQLFRALELDPGLVPSSNLVFARSPRTALLKGAKELERLCWSFHARAIQMLQSRFIICLGRESGKFVSSRLGASREIDKFVEPNSRRWTSTACKAPSGQVVLTLTHPSQAKWTTPSTDPRPMVQRVLRGFG